MVKRRTNKLDDPMSIAQAFRHAYIDQIMATFAEEISSLKTMKAFVEFTGRLSDIPKDYLLPFSLWFTTLMANSRNLKQYLLQVKICEKSSLHPDTYACTVRANTLRLLLSSAAEHDLDLVSHDFKTASLNSNLKPNKISTFVIRMV